MTRKPTIASLESIALVTMAAEIVKFGTKTIKKDPVGIQHVLKWSSSSGRNADLRGLRVREAVRWTAAPAAFGPFADPRFQRSGSHNGLIPNGTPAENCQNEDTHLAVPTGFSLSADLRDGQPSDVWVMTQTYQVGNENTPWRDIPEAEYTISRWLERRKTTLFVYIKKQSVTKRNM
jgi:hypothetical protein